MNQTHFCETNSEQTNAPQPHCDPHLLLFWVGPKAEKKSKIISLYWQMFATFSVNNDNPGCAAKKNNKKKLVCI